jgi:CheY-like chemotaxis protein
LYIRILVVTDDAVQLQALVCCLAAQRYFVETAADGIEALRKARSIAFDLVLIDGRLPEVEGAAVASLIQDMAPRRGRPHLVGLSAALPGAPAPPPLPDGVFDTMLTIPCPEERLLCLVERLGRQRRDDAALACDGSPDGSENRDPRAPIQQDVVDAGTSSCARVLVVDDDARLRDVVQAALREAGCDVAIAGDGLAAFREIARAPYDVVVLDVQMPQIDGLATARLVLDVLSRADRPRLIALTSAPDLLRRRESGTTSVFDEIISKANGVAALAASVRRSVAYRRRNPPRDLICIGDLGSLSRLLGAEPLGVRCDMAGQPSQGEAAAPPVLDEAALESIGKLLPQAVVAGHLRLLARAGGALLGRLRAPPVPGEEADLLNATHDLAGSAGLLGFRLLSARSAQYERASLGAPAERPGAARDLGEAIELALAAIQGRLLAMADA